MMSMVGRFRQTLGGLKMVRTTTTTTAPPNHQRIIGGGVPKFINPRSFRTNHPPHTPPQNPTYAGPTKFYSKSDQYVGDTRGFFSMLYDSVCGFCTDFRMTKRQLFVLFGIVFVLPPVARVCDDLFNPNCFTYRKDANHVTYVFKLGKDVTEDQIQLHILRKAFLVVSSGDGKKPIFKKRLPNEKFSKVEKKKFLVKEDSASLIVDVTAVNSSSWLKKFIQFWVNE